MYSISVVYCGAEFATLEHFSRGDRKPVTGFISWPRMLSDPISFSQRGLAGNKDRGRCSFGGRAPLAPFRLKLFTSRWYFSGAGRWPLRELQTGLPPVRPAAASRRCVWSQPIPAELSKPRAVSAHPTPPPSTWLEALRVPRFLQLQTGDQYFVLNSIRGFLRTTDYSTVIQDQTLNRGTVNCL